MDNDKMKTQLDGIIMKHHISTIVRLINSDKSISASNLTAIGDITMVILQNNLGHNEKATIYLSLLYRLIFHAYKYNPSVACRILNSFIQFGHTPQGMSCKPMLDYFVIEAFNELYNMFGWTILKPCVTVLRDTNTNYRNEPLFKHILTQVGEQLSEDINDIPYSSDLCYNLPREKSFSWGWFSYDLTRSYYGSVSAKQLRKNMMIYRKLLTELRRNTLEKPVIILNTNMAQVNPNPAIRMEEKWEDILSALAEYTWASDIIKKVINIEEEAEPLEASEADPSEADPSEADPSEADPSEEASEKVEEPIVVEDPSEADPSEADPIKVEAIEADPIVEKPDALIEKNEPLEGVEGGIPLNKGWFSWLGWS